MKKQNILILILVALFLMGAAWGSVRYLYVYFVGINDNSNSTIVTLDADSTYTGTWVDITNFGTVSIGVKSNVASATDGMSIQWSHDGATMIDADIYTVPANTGKTYSFYPVGKYYRLVYTNGGTNQATFNMQAMLRTGIYALRSHRIGDPIVDEDDADLITSVIKAKGDDGIFRNVIASIAGALRTISKPYSWAVSEDEILGVDHIDKFGENLSVGTDLVEVWDGLIAYVWMDDDSTLFLSSSDAGDDQDYEIQGLDANWVAQVDTVTATGVDFAVLSGTWRRVFRIKNIGTTDNAGIIYVCTDSTNGGDGVPDVIGTVKAQITVGENQTLMALWTVPDNGTTGYLSSFYGSTSSRQATQIRLYVRPFGGVFQIKKTLTIFEGPVTFPFEFPMEVSSKSDIVIRAKLAASTGVVSAGFTVHYK